MTLVSIITQSLTTLGMSTDAQSTEAWKGKLTMFANDGTKDIAQRLKLRKVEEVEVNDGTFAVPSDCVKVLSVTQNGSDVDFTISKDSKKVKVNTDGSVQIEYRYVPKDMSEDIDKPDIPEWLHNLLVPYICNSEHMTRDPNTQRRANMFMQKYEEGLKEARRNLGETDTYNIYNKGW